jgi:hypothetical protein
MTADQPTTYPHPPRHQSPGRYILHLRLPAGRLSQSVDIGGD